VLLCGRHGLEKVATLPRRVSVFPFGLYPATSTEGPFGEPATAADGLIEHGEGGTTCVFLYQKGAFQVTEHASENH